MKPLSLYAAIAIAAIMTTTPTFASDDNDVLFKFDGGIGSQPLRAGSAVNAVAGVNPGGAPWPIKSFKAVIKTDGTIRAKAKGILLGGTDNIGTRGGPRQMVVSLFCRGTVAPTPPAVARVLDLVPYNSAFVDLDPNGDFELSSSLTNATGATPPADCGDKIDNRPVLLIRTVGGTPPAPTNWFAAGILDD
jgi:hypothetical protein